MLHQKIMESKSELGRLGEDCKGWRFGTDTPWMLLQREKEEHERKNALRTEHVTDSLHSIAEQQIQHSIARVRNPRRGISAPVPAKQASHNHSRFQRLETPRCLQLSYPASQPASQPGAAIYLVPWALHIRFAYHHYYYYRTPAKA